MADRPSGPLLLPSTPQDLRSLTFKTHGSFMASTSTLPALARSKVTIVSMRIDRDDSGRRTAALRLKQPSSGAVVSVIATKPTLIDALFSQNRSTLWSALIDRADRKRMVLVDATMTS